MGESVMKKISVIFICLIISTFSVQAENQADEFLDSANIAYTNGNFEQAVNYYESILEHGYESAAVFFNLGNAYYKQNIIDKAILNYERALLLKPDDNDIKYNLEMANQFTVDRIEKLPDFFLSVWVKNMINWFSSDSWAIISISTFILALVFISIFLYTQKYGVKKLSFWIGLALAIITIFSLFFSYKQKKNVVIKDTAIVMEPSVTVKSSPDISGTDLFVIHEGTKVWLQDEVGEWKEIKLSDGSKGWLRTDDIEEI